NSEDADRNLCLCSIDVIGFFEGGECAEEIAYRKHIDHHILPGDGMPQQLHLSAGDDVQMGGSVPVEVDRLSGFIAVFMKQLIDLSNHFMRQMLKKRDLMQDRQTQIQIAHMGLHRLNSDGGCSALRHDTYILLTMCYLPLLS